MAVQYCNYRWLTCLLTAVVFSWPVSALASSPVSNVGSADVNKGELSIEHRMGMSFDDESSGDHERLRMRQHIDYGWTQWYANRIVIEQDKPGTDSMEFRSISFENRFQVFEKDIHG